MVIIKVRIDEQLKMLCLKSNMSLAEMARRLNKTPQAFNQKMKRGNFTVEELTDIALVSGCVLKCEFVYPNGDKITIE
jgi:transcriptional regulator with XRE-family HTH domain